MLSRVKQIFNRALLLLTVALGGCASERAFHEQESPLDTALLGTIHMTGSHTLSGTVVVRTQEHGQRLGRFETVTLLVDTTYSRKCGELSVEASAKCEQRLAAYALSTSSDQSGRFAFKGLAPGKYVLWSNVGWSYSRGKLGTGHRLIRAFGDAVLDANKPATTVELTNR